MVKASVKSVPMDLVPLPNSGVPSKLMDALPMESGSSQAVNKVAGGEQTRFEYFA